MNKLKINIFSSSRYKLSRREIKRVVKEILAQKGVQTGVLNIAFVGKIKMRRLSRDYKNENVALPVLTFPYFQHQTKSEFLLGEIVICYPQAVLLAAERDKPVSKILEFLLTHAVDNLFKQHR